MLEQKLEAVHINYLACVQTGPEETSEMDCGEDEQEQELPSDGHSDSDDDSSDDDLNPQ